MAMYVNRFEDGRSATSRSEIYSLSPAAGSLDIGLGNIPCDTKR